MLYYFCVIIYALNNITSLGDVYECACMSKRIKKKNTEAVYREIRTEMYI